MSSDDTPTPAELFAKLKGAAPFFVIAGTNVVESEEHVLSIARSVKQVTDELGLELVFKASWDKANRTSMSSFRGMGIDAGLAALAKVKSELKVPICTDFHESMQADKVAEVADVLQIPAFLCRQTDLLVAAAKTGKVINIKKGQFANDAVMKNAAKKVIAAGNSNVLLCERGNTFGYGDLIVDFRNITWMRRQGHPVVMDITHSLQQPAQRKTDDSGGVASAGLRDMIPTIARAAVAVGVDGIFIECHNDIANAPVDGPVQWPLDKLKEFLSELIAVAAATNAKQPGGDYVVV